MAGGSVPIKTISINHHHAAGGASHHHHGLPGGPTAAAAAAAGDGGGGGGGADHTRSSNQESSPPAFPGAKHDVKGYCIVHSKIRLCQLIFGDDAKNGGTEPIKYRTVRKICPQCGVHQPMQNVRKLRRKSSQDKESSSSPKDSNTTEIGMAVVPKMYNNREGDPHCAVVKSRKHHGNKYQNQRVASDNQNDKNVEKEKGRENKDTTVKAKDCAKEKEKSINKSDNGITMQKDKGVRRDIINDAHPSGTRAARQQHSSPPHRQSKQQQHAHAAAGKESKHHVAETKNKGGAHPHANHMKQHADDIPLIRSPNVPKYTVKFTRGGTMTSQPSPNNSSPMLPFTRQGKGGRDDNNEDDDDKESERATGVFMMAAGLLPLYNNSDSKKESHDEEEQNSIKENDKNHNYENKALGTTKEQDTIRRSSAEEQLKKTPNAHAGNKDKPESSQHVVKAPPGNSSNKETSNDGPPDKMDFSKLWESHTNINKESDHHHHGKKDSKKSSSSGPKREGPINKKMPTNRISSSSSKVVRQSSSKGGRLRVGSSFNNKDPSPKEGKKGDHHRTNTAAGADMKNNDDSQNRRSRHSNRGRSKSLPQHQQRQQRERVPSEHHVPNKQHHSSTLSTYRQAFLEEMAQSNIAKG